MIWNVEYKITNMYIMILRTSYLFSAQSINIDYPLEACFYDIFEICLLYVPKQQQTLIIWC